MAQAETTEREDAEITKPMAIIVNFDYQDDGPTSDADAQAIAAAFKKRDFYAEVRTVTNEESMLDQLSLQKAVRKPIRKKLTDCLFVLVCARVEFVPEAVKTETGAETGEVVIVPQILAPRGDRGWERQQTSKKASTCLFKGNTEMPIFDQLVEVPLGESLVQFRGVPRVYVVVSQETQGHPNLKADEEVAKELKRLALQPRIRTATRGTDKKDPERFYETKFNLQEHRDCALVLAHTRAQRGSKVSPFAEHFANIFEHAFEGEDTIDLDNLFFHLVTQYKEDHLLVRFLAKFLRKNYELGT